MFRPKALSFRLIVFSLGRFRIDVRREERASGISFRRRPVNISARLATYGTVPNRGSQRPTGTHAKAKSRGPEFSYLKGLLCSKNLTQQLASANTKSIA